MTDRSTFFAMILDKALDTAPYNSIVAMILHSPTEAPITTSFARTVFNPRSYRDTPMSLAKKEERSSVIAAGLRGEITPQAATDIALQAYLILEADVPRGEFRLINFISIKLDDDGAVVIGCEENSERFAQALDDMLPPPRLRAGTPHLTALVAA